jgi:ATP phosphoribosyltransferase
MTTMQDIIDYTAAVMANPRVQLMRRRDAAMERLNAARTGTFAAHRYATAYLHIATERCDAAFNMELWRQDPARDQRREALFSHLRMIRRQIKRAKMAMREAA